MPTVDQLSKVKALLAEGKVQEAADMISAIETAEKFIADSAAAVPAPPPPPRPPEPIISDILHAIVAHLGNPGRLESLLAELRTTLGISL